jgi:2-oxoglutarate ferredoxin oxidoreductase subunit beta
MEKSLTWGDEIPIGRFFERTDLPSLNEADPVLKAGPLVKQDYRLAPELAKAFVDELM